MKVASRQVSREKRQGRAGERGTFEKVQNARGESDSRREGRVQAAIRGGPADTAPETASGAIRKLTLLDLEIINGVVAGHSNREIASQMFTTGISVKHQLRVICDRLEISGRLELALFVIEHELIRASDSVRSQAKLVRAEEDGGSASSD